MDRWSGKVAVVTGASGGIGLAIAKTLFREGMIIVAVARRKEKIESEMKNIKGKGKLHCLKCDVSKEEDVIQLFEWIKKNLGTVHVVVNNAGDVIGGKIIDTNKEDWERVVNVNLMGVLYCCQQAIKLMKESGEESHIININSIAGHRIIREERLQSNVYPATKHAITALTTILELELLGNRIRTTSVSPGHVKSQLVANDSAEQLHNVLHKMPSIEPQDVAESIVYILGTHPRVQITELTIRPLGETL